MAALQCPVLLCPVLLCLLQLCLLQLYLLQLCLSQGAAQLKEVAQSTREVQIAKNSTRHTSKRVNGHSRYLR